MAVLLAIAAVPSGGYAYASVPDAMQQKSAAKSGDIHGTIVDTQGEPLIGASVMVKGTSIGTTTDLEGRFSLSDVAKGTLYVSYVGYTPVEIKIVPGQTYNITLKENDALLDEVVVVGYGSQKK